MTSFPIDSSISRIAVIVSDHGFGHAGRVSAFLPHLLSRGAHLLVISGVPLSFFLESLVDPRAEAAWRAQHAACAPDHPAADDPAALLRDLLPTVHFAHLQTDVGVRQLDAIRIDAAATAAALDRFFTDFDRSVARIETLVRDFNANAIVFDISALAPAVAKRLALPAIGVSNFDWAFIYDSMVHVDPVFATYAQRHRDAYRDATHLVVLPAATPMPAFDHARQVRLPGWTGRRSTMARADARRILGMLGDERRYVVLTFGGHNQLSVVGAETRSTPTHWCIVTIDASPLRAGEVASDAIAVVRRGDGAVTLRLAALRALHFVRFVDVIAAADVVVTKPGYGTVSELILNQVPSLWVSRPGFAEEPFLAAELAAHTVTEQIDAAHVLSADDALFAAAQRVFDAHQTRGVHPVPHHNDTLAQQILDWSRAQ
jgi:hypothetical protein